MQPRLQEYFDSNWYNIQPHEKASPNPVSNKVFNYLTRGLRWLIMLLVGKHEFFSKKDALGIVAIQAIVRNSLVSYNIDGSNSLDALPRGKIRTGGVNKVLGEGFTQDIWIPEVMIGRLIGRGGMNLKIIRDHPTMNCHVSVDHENRNGSKRKVTLRGNYREQVDAGCNKCIELVTQGSAQSSGAQVEKVQHVGKSHSSHYWIKRGCYQGVANCH